MNAPTEHDPLSFTFWRDKTIEAGLASVRQHETGAQRQGGLRGFEACRTLGSLAALERELRELRTAEVFLADALTAGTITRDRYIEHRCITLQVEHVYERMKIMVCFFGVHEEKEQAGA